MAYRLLLITVLLLAFANPALAIGGLFAQPMGSASSSFGTVDGLARFSRLCAALCACQALPK